MSGNGNNCEFNSNPSDVESVCLVPAVPLKLQILSDVLQTDWTTQFMGSTTYLRLRACGDGVVSFDDICCFEGNDNEFQQNNLVLKLPISINVDNCSVYKIDFKTMQDTLGVVFGDDFSSSYGNVVAVTNTNTSELSLINLQVSSGYLWIKIKFSQSDLDGCNLKYKIKLNIPILKTRYLCDSNIVCKPLQWALEGGAYVEPPLPLAPDPLPSVQ